MFGLGTLKLALIGSAVSVALGFYAGQRWEKAAHYKALNKQVAAVIQQSQDNIELLNTRWEQEVARVKLDVETWKKQNSIDEAGVKALLVGQTEIIEKFNEIDKQITSVQVGECKLSANAILLLNTASAAANSTPESPDRLTQPDED